MRFPPLVRTATIVLGLSGISAHAYTPGPLPEQPLPDFGVYRPPVVPSDVEPCTVLLTHHLFANSYGSPAIVQYEPPTGCGEPGTWTSIVLNFTATSNGTQYDRLSTIYLSNVEIWRTSTPEPTALGIIWTAQKDVSRYSPLLAQPGEMIVDLGNIVDPSSGLTGEYDGNASFYPSSIRYPAAKTADVILPLSTLSNSSANLFTVPPSGSTNVTIPRNSAQAFVEIYASGNGDEEFWYGNVPDEYFDQLPTWSAPDGYASPHGPFREVQLLIDGILAGVVFPYPVIYTGEFLPSLWRPMVSYGAFDSPTYYVDITPFLGSLSSSPSPTHNFTLAIVGMGPGQPVNANWYVSGNVQVVLDSTDQQTNGSVVVYEGGGDILAEVEGRVSGANVSVSTMAGRRLYVEGEIWTGSGYTRAVWEQNLNFTNSEVYQTTLGNVSVQTVTQTSKGVSSSTHNGIPVVSDVFTYPLYLQLQYATYDNGSFYDYIVDLDHSFVRSLATGVQPLAENIDTRQICQGTQVWMLFSSVYTLLPC
ncbi:hypothetical protein NEOLEDRAFT_1054711 [Neolentinus lepideus HHB14362 ss-1]|uniref:Peptide N-acetyl-beta-D-glucosaminyl asparaginase amidase A N-terminal domain-containing protein n=1 Tax=Neolentinus lepideus HHB14362 ss-1 TaxID=1314782 RepID=A0A165VSU3_9AGAM|nr:hypothetical protein NEOLEDRAFT_1054711 [Neolentinus lepideus HHB14362 ss-1]